MVHPGQPLPEVLISHMGTSSSLATPFLIQLHGNLPEKVAEDDLSICTLSLSLLSNKSLIIMMMIIIIRLAQKSGTESSDHVARSIR